eukprot:Selendium_serpulae@DN4725_c0_g1_i1.p1
MSSRSSHSSKAPNYPQGNYVQQPMYGQQMSHGKGSSSQIRMNPHNSQHVVHEKIIEVPKKVIRERIVEVPEIEYVEKIVEVPQTVVEERVKQVAKIQYQDRIIQVPKPVYVDKIVEVPEIEYRNIPVEKIVEVPEIREEIVLKEVEVPEIVEVPVPEYQTVQHEEEIQRRIPVPVEVNATFEYKMPRIVPKYKEQPVPIYVPRFIEVPIPSQMMDANTINDSQELYNRLTGLSQRGSVSLSEFQQLAQDSQAPPKNRPPTTAGAYSRPMDQKPSASRGGTYSAGNYVAA